MADDADGDDPHDCLPGVVRVLADAGRLEQALATSEAIDSWWKGGVLASLADDWRDAGQPERALDIFRRALAVSVNQRSQFLWTLGLGTKHLANIDGGDTLGRTLDALVEVGQWWAPPR